MKVLKTLGKIIGILLGAFVLAAVVLFVILMATEFKPEASEEMTVDVHSETRSVTVGDTLTVMTWNAGYGALGDNADFFMDGGTMVDTADEERVMSNLNGMLSVIRTVDPDILMMQEVDADSRRSHHIDETEFFAENVGGTSSFGTNFKTWFLPYPVPPIGKVHGGVLTITDLPVESATRLSLPCPYSWPVSMVNLKRCLLVSRVPLEGSDRELVIVNLHLEAYDDGEGKIEQTKMLCNVLKEELDKGNYVIAGGDFNQFFSDVDTSAFPVYPERWAPGVIDVETFGDAFQFCMDNRTPSCRSLDQVYTGADHENFQYYLLDGFIVSDNIRIEEFYTDDQDFRCTDHNPVILRMTLGGEEE